MSDLSMPPLSLVPKDQTPSSPAPGTERARFAWPTPSLPCYPAPMPAAAPEPCVIEGLNGSSMAGRLMHF
ncbi:MAG: hypothetical protein JNJ89_12040, partial [Rubrivivax sp.]|nr:hypothetical protein [Rubrivivax sp.]